MPVRIRVAVVVTSAAPFATASGARAAPPNQPTTSVVARAAVAGSTESLAFTIKIRPVAPAV